MLQARFSDCDSPWQATVPKLELFYPNSLLISCCLGYIWCLFVHRPETAWMLVSRGGIIWWYLTVFQVYCTKPYLYFNKTSSCSRKVHLFLSVVYCIIWFTVVWVTCCQLGAVLMFLFRAGSLTYTIIWGRLLILRKMKHIEDRGSILNYLKSIV